MQSQTSMSSEGIVLQIRYAGGEAVLVDFFVLLAASLAAIILFIVMVDLGVSAQVLDKYAVLLAAPWFATLYFVSQRLKRSLRKGFTLSLSSRFARRGLEVVGATALVVVAMTNFVAKLVEKILQ
jgi:hypothetical protein